MRKTLHLPLDPHPAFGTLLNHINGAGRDKPRGYELTVANAIWAQKGFPWHKAFTDLTQKHYGSGLSFRDPDGITLEFFAPPA